jgi:hypothetical protein
VAGPDLQPILQARGLPLPAQLRTTKAAEPLPDTRHSRLSRGARANRKMPALTGGSVHLDESVRRTQRQEAIGFLLDHRIALAGKPFQSRSVQHSNVSTAVCDYAAAACVSTYRPAWCSGT